MRQEKVRWEPWYSTTLLLPAAWCSPSMFWVMMPATAPALSSSARAMWPGLGRASSSSSISASMFHTLAGSRMNAPSVAYSAGL